MNAVNICSEYMLRIYTVFIRYESVRAVHIHKCVRSAYTQMSAQWGRLYTVYISCIYSVYIVYKQCKYTQSSAEWGRLYAMHALVAPPFKASFG